MANYPHFEKLKRRYISAKHWSILPKFGTMMYLGPLDPINQYNLEILQIQGSDSSHLKIEKIAISQTPSDWFKWNLDCWCILAFWVLWTRKRNQHWKWKLSFTLFKFPVNVEWKILKLVIKQQALFIHIANGDGSKTTKIIKGDVTQPYSDV